MYFLRELVVFGVWIAIVSVRSLNRFAYNVQEAVVPILKIADVAEILIVTACIETIRAALTGERSSRSKK